MAVITDLPLRIEGDLGSVHARITVSNHEDEVDVRRGRKSLDEVRSVDLEGVLVETGASTLCLPQDLVDRLGLPINRQIVALTAGGDIETNVYGDATVTVAGRSRVVECVALPVGSRPLLGVIPLEMLGMEPDLKNRVLRVLPDDTKDSYIFV